MTLSTSTRSTPVGDKPANGHGTKIALSGDTDISFWEKEVTPPGVECDDPNDTTTMHNTAWRTTGARALKRLTPVQLTVTYDPVVYDQIIAQVRVNQSITVIFWNGDTLDFHGLVKSFQPTGLSDDGQPEATMEIVPTLTDPSTGAETAPNYKTSTGTD